MARLPTAEGAGWRLREVGATAVSTSELISIITGVDIASAQNVMTFCDGSVRALANVSEPPPKSGLSKTQWTKLNAAMELGRRAAREGAADRQKIMGPRNVYEFLSPRLRDAVQEEFWVLILNIQHKVLREHMVSRGVLDTSLVHPREVFREAISRSASAVILVHNHPSGDPTPSVEDREITKQLAAAGKVIGIPVIDHVIIGDARYVSFVEAGLLGLSKGLDWI